MATLTTPKLSAAIKPTRLPAIQLRRNKLAQRLWEQAELAKAKLAGTQCAPTRFRAVVKNDTGSPGGRKQTWP